MKPEDISKAEFSTVSRGGYSTAEVDAFLQKVAAEFSSLVKNDEDLRRRMARMLETIREYDKEKEHIYKTLVNAQALADTKVSEATTQAEEIMAQAGAQAQQLLGEKRAEADSYYYEKTHGAEERLTVLQAQISELEGKYSTALDDYIRLAREKAAAIIQKATDDAAAIVAAAYDDAKKARSQAEEIVADAQSKLTTLSKAVALFKGQVVSAVESIAPAMGAIEIDTEFVAPVTEVEVTSAKAVDVPEFVFEPSKQKEAPVAAESDPTASWEDMSSTFATPQKPQTPDEAEETSEFFRPSGTPLSGDDLFGFADDGAPSKFFYDTGDADSSGEF